MSGYGRSKSVLKKFFNNIEMLEQSPEMTADYMNDVQKHQMKI